MLERTGMATVGLNVLQAGKPAIGPIRATILQIEHEHTRSELDFFEQARGFPDITAFVVNELAVDLSQSCSGLGVVFMWAYMGWQCQAQLQLEVGALFGRTAATTFTATRESTFEPPTHEAMPAQAFSARL